MKQPLRALIVEDSEDDAQLLLRELGRCGYDVTHERVETAAAMRTALTTKTWDIILSDYAMPSFSGIEALAVLKASGLGIPVVVISGTIGEETAVEILKAGAQDFLVKGRLARLSPAIERGLREAEVRREREATREALARSELQYRRIVETAQEGIWTIDADARTTYMNRRMAEMLGGDAETLLGASMFEFMDDERKKAALSTLERGRQGIAEQFDFRFQRRNRTEFWASVSASPIADEAGRYLGALTMVTDITERRDLQTQLMMSDRMACVGTLAASIAHDINTPLAAALTNLELSVGTIADLAGRAGAPVELRGVEEEIRDAREAAERVRRIVQDLKIFSRVKEEKRGPVDVHRVLESSVRLARNELRHRTKLVKQYGSVPFVEGDESPLGQVFLNLIINAAQSIPEGRADANEIGLTTRLDPSGRVAVEVRDTGSGMTPEVMKQLFTPFFTTKPTGVGTGLGLAICHQIVTALGGAIEVQSRVGEGSLFRVLLPRATSVVLEEVVKPPSSVPGARRRGRVLVVDDEPMIALAIQRAVRREHEVVTTTSAREALDRIGSGEHFDVILCDLMMPEMTGMDFHAELLRTAPGQAKQMIFLTGGAFTAGARAFLDEVTNVHIDKPFSVQALLATINARVR